MLSNDPNGQSTEAINIMPKIYTGRVIKASEPFKIRQKVTVKSDQAGEEEFTLDGYKAQTALGGMGHNIKLGDKVQWKDLKALMNYSCENVYLEKAE